ncbi:MAG: hypothetical protein ACP5TL_02370 [Candidatus Micrarchaeia archaeon]
MAEGEKPANEAKADREANSEMLFKRKQLLVLLALKDSTQDWYISTLAKAANATYVHTCNFINECEKRGITVSEKHGKIKRVKLTEKGLKLAELLSNSYALIKEPQVAQKKSDI